MLKEAEEELENKRMKAEFEALKVTRLDKWIKRFIHEELEEQVTPTYAICHAIILTWSTDDMGEFERDVELTRQEAGQKVNEAEDALADKRALRFIDQFDPEQPEYVQEKDTGVVRLYDQYKMPESGRAGYVQQSSVAKYNCSHHKWARQVRDARDAKEREEAAATASGVTLLQMSDGTLVNLPEGAEGVISQLTGHGAHRASDALLDTYGAHNMSTNVGDDTIPKGGDDGNARASDSEKARSDAGASSAQDEEEEEDSDMDMALYGAFYQKKTDPMEKIREWKPKKVFGSLAGQSQSKTPLDKFNDKGRTL